MADGAVFQFYYDAMGDIQQKIVNGVTSQYSYADASHPYAVTAVTNIGGGTYSASYGADGNMTTRNGYAISWTPANLPSSIASAQGSSTFSYGPDGNRYSQTATFNGTTSDTTYVGGLFEVISTSTGTTEYRHNIVADGQVIAVHAINGNGAASTSYLHYDHLGSVDAITDDQGNVIQTMSFDAFGLRRDAANWDYDLSQNQIATLKNYTDRGFTDQEQLDNLSLVDMNGRVYDPTVGRMISADPTVPDAFFSQAFNRFAYVDDSPLEYTDPSGYDKLAVIVVNCNWWCQYLALMQGSNMFAAYWYYQLVSSPPVVPPGVGGHGGPGSHGSAKPPTNSTQPQQQPQQNNKKHTSCSAQQGSGGLASHFFASASMQGGTIAAGELGVSASTQGLSGEGGLSLGYGAAVDVVGGYQGGTPEPYGLTSTFVLGPDVIPVGVYVQITSGPYGSFYRIGFGFEEGEFVSESPSFTSELANAPIDESPCAPGG